MPPFQVRRWRKYGHDRLYVNDAGGTLIGWLDLRTGRRHLEDPRRASDLAAALAAHAPTAPTMGPAPVNRDLAFRRPGQEASGVARRKRDAAPVGTFFARLLGLHNTERAWRIGARGEVVVGRWLRRLPPSWKALHSIPLERGDIDHLVIGPGGVFTLNSKHHPRASIWAAGNVLMVNGHRKPYITTARWEAEHAARALGRAVGRRVPVTGVVVVVGAHRTTVREQPWDGRVLVANPRPLVQWMGRLPAKLSPEEVRLIHAAARSSTTWR